MTIRYFCHIHGSQPTKPCPICKRERAQRRRASPKRRATYGAGTRGKAWLELSKRFLATRPLCERDCGRESSQVHHRDGAGPEDPSWLDEANLVALCVHCHREIEAEKQPRDAQGQWM